MNWTKGFRRIAFVWAILAAIVCAVLGISIADRTKALTDAREKLKRADRHWTDTSVLLEQWRVETSFEDQKLRWKWWTEEDLEESARKSNLYSYETSMDWKEQGWQTFNGEELPYTPAQVAWLIRGRIIREARNDLQRTKLTYNSAGAAIGGTVGFAIAWLVYLTLKQVALWIALGFRNDETHPDLSKDKNDR